MAELDPAVEEQLAQLSDDDWRSLSARVRPPTSSQQLREIAGKVLEGAALDSFVAVADPRKFAGANGDVDETKVMGALTGLFTSGQQQQQPDHGQGSAPGGPTVRVGDRARAEIAKRYGVENGSAPGLAAGIRPGAAARAELAKRYGRQK